MGQGYSLSTLSAGSAGIDIPELSDLVYEKSMGGGRFMKSIRARRRNGLAFVKVMMKPYPSMTLDRYIEAIFRKWYRTFIYGERVSDMDTGERKVLSDVPNALSYQRAIETSNSGYLVRQYIHSSLYDRMRYVPHVFTPYVLTEIAPDRSWKTSKRNGLRFSFYVRSEIVIH